MFWLKGFFGSHFSKFEFFVSIMKSKSKKISIIEMIYSGLT